MTVFNLFLKASLSGHPLTYSEIASRINKVPLLIQSLLYEAYM